MAHILIIEDNPTNLELMSYLLKAFGHSVVAAEDGDKGLATAQRERPDIVLCDVQLPGIDGYEVLREIKADAVLKSIPVVAVTALAMAGDREKGLAIGFDGYISKPIEPKKFVGEIEQFLAEEQRGAAPQRRNEGSSSLGKAVRGARGSVLVVDDSPTNRELIFHTLTPFGYDVRLAATVAEGLEMADARHPDLVLSDLHMPEEDGFVLIRRLRADARFSSLPIILVSSSLWGARDRQTAAELGVARFLFRPLEPQTLISEVSRCIAPHKEIARGNGVSC
jgi:two-component system cell cycle response regulator